MRTPRITAVEVALALAFAICIVAVVVIATHAKAEGAIPSAPLFDLQSFITAVLVFNVLLCVLVAVLAMRVRALSKQAALQERLTLAMHNAFEKMGWFDGETGQG